jgi:hypothetical protein
MAVDSMVWSEFGYTNPNRRKTLGAPYLCRFSLELWVGKGGFPLGLFGFPPTVDSV